MSATKQIIAVTAMNVRAISNRLGASLVIVLGMAAVVGVLLSVLSMSVGMVETVRQNTSPGGVIILSQGANTEGQSNIPRETVLAIMDTPGIKKGPDGKPLVSAETQANFGTTKRVSHFDVFVCVRGAGENLMAVHPDFTLVEGRMYKPGLREFIAGESAIKYFEGTEIGAQVPLADGMWTVVGVFSSPGGYSSCLFGDAETLLSSLRRNAFGMVDLRLADASEETFQQFKTALASNPAIAVEAMREATYYERALQGPVNFYKYVAYGVGGIMGLGAIFAALNTMYAAVSARAIEIATLRAIGFGASSVVISVMIEALSLAIGGAAIGAAGAWFIFHEKVEVFGNFAINLAVTPAMVGGGVLVAVGVGFLAALMPAIRAARLPLVTALQVR